MDLSDIMASAPFESSTSKRGTAGAPMLANWTVLPVSMLETSVFPATRAALRSASSSKLTMLTLRPYFVK